MKHLARERGTTLLESLVGMAMFAIISSGLFALFAGTCRNFSYTTKSSGLQTDISAALNVFLDDVSLTGFSGYTATAYNPSGGTTATGADGTDTRAVIPPGTALPSITMNGGANGNPPDSIQFIADIASPGALGPDGRPDRVTYQVTSGNLTRTIELGDNAGGYTGGTTSDSLAAKVTGFQIRAYKQDHTTITSNSESCYIGATVYTVDSTVKGGIPLGRNLSGEATLRNFLSLGSCAS
jgi:type II secretory pathway component PulJ